VICYEFQKPNIWSKKNAGVRERAQTDLEQKTEDADVMDRARHDANIHTEFQLCDTSNCNIYRYILRVW